MTNPVLTVTDTDLEVHTQNFPHLHHDAWLAMQEWCRFHDIDPNWVPMCSRIVRNVDACRVEYDEIVVGFDGAKVIERDGDDLVVVTHRVHSQGEAPPLPWPAEVWAAAGGLPEEAHRA